MEVESQGCPLGGHVSPYLQWQRRSNYQHLLHSNHHLLGLLFQHTQFPEPCVPPLWLHLPVLLHTITHKSLARQLRSPNLYGVRVVASRQLNVIGFEVRMVEVSFQNFSLLHQLDHHGMQTSAIHD